MTGKVVLITGASRGIGAAVARRLAAGGDRLALVGLEPDELRQVAADCGPQAHWWEADVTDLDSLRTAVEGVVERYGRIDVVVANAGIAVPGFARTLDAGAFERVVAVNLVGVWRTVHLTLPHLLASRGYLLLVSSLAAVVQIPGIASYNAAKAGVEALGNTLRAELRHLGVAVGVAHLTFVKTDMVDGAGDHPVYGKALRGIPGARVYPLELAVDKFVAGIGKRARVVHVPAWISLLKLVRATIPRTVELISRFQVPKADREAAADVAARGADVSSQAVGPGGRADASRSRPPKS